MRVGKLPEAADEALTKDGKHVRCACVGHISSFVLPGSGFYRRRFDSIPGTAQRKPGSDLGVAMPMEGS